MTKLVIGAAVGLLVGVVLAAAIGIHAEGTEPDADTLALAESAGVDPVDLLGAANTTHLSPADYLALEPSWIVGELAAPTVSSPPLACGWPICGSLGQRLYCIEGYESHHNGAAVNARSGAAGWLQWLPGTARRWGVSIGNRWSEWSAAAEIAALGQRFFTSQWVPLQLGVC